jgi:phospholipid/cholesterol/gamma-HCH transport system permease protein
MIVSTVAIIHGFAVVRATTEVPVAGLRSVGTAFGLCIIVDVILSAVYYFFNGF